MMIQVMQLFAGLALLALEGIALWGAVEGIYWIYCKATGRRY